MHASRSRQNFRLPCRRPAQPAAKPPPVLHSQRPKELSASGGSCGKIGGPEAPAALMERQTSTGYADGNDQRRSPFRKALVCALLVQEKRHRYLGSKPQQENLVESTNVIAWNLSFGAAQISGEKERISMHLFKISESHKNKTVKCSRTAKTRSDKH